MLSVGRLIKDQQILKKQLPKNPLVSVIMPTYCRKEDSLRKSIESVLNQTFKDFEFIIIDDGSRDGTFQILQEYQNKDSRIMIIRHDLNCGLPAIRVNEGIMHARGKYISYQFDDDEWLPNCLQILVEKINKQTKECVVYGKCEAVIEHESGKIEKMYLGTQVDHTLLKNRNYIANNSVIHHSSIFNLTGLYDPHILLRRCCDYDLWLRMSKYVPFIYVNQLVSKVNAGKKNSLGVDENLLVIRMSNIRIMLEINRNELLKADKILTYHVDDMSPFTTNFSQRVIDTINRVSFIPYRLKANYYLRQSERFIANLSRPTKKMMAIVKKLYSKSVEIMIGNFTKRISNFPYDHYFIVEDEFFFIKPEDYDLLLAVGEAGESFNKYINNHKGLSTPVINALDDFMFHYYEKERNNAVIQLNDQFTQQILKGNLSILCDDINRNLSESIYFKRIFTNIPDQYLVQKKKEQSTSKVKIALFAHESLDNELKMIYTALKNNHRIKDLIIDLWGHTTIPFSQLPCIVENRSFNKNFENHLKELKVYHYDYYICPYDDHYEAYSKSILIFIEGTAMGAVGIFSNKGPFKSIADELCYKVNHNDWSSQLEKILDQSEDERYGVYYKAYHNVRKFHLTECQAQRFIANLDASFLLKKMKSKKIAYFLSNNSLDYQIETMMIYSQIAKDYGFNVVICLPNKPSQHLLKVVEGCRDPVVDFQYAHELLDRELSNQLATWLQTENIGFVHNLGYLPTIGYACEIAKVPYVNSLYDQVKQTVNKNNMKGYTHYIHTTSNASGALWSHIFEVPFCKVVYPVEGNYFDLYEIKRIKKTSNHKKRIFISGLTNISEIKQQLISLGLNERVELIESINLNDYKNIDVLISNHMDESINREVLRSMASGVLVLALKTSQINEMIKDHYNGFVFEDSNAQTFLERLKGILELEETEMEEILNNAFHTALMTCSKDYIASELIHLYNEALDVFFKF